LKPAGHRLQPHPSNATSVCSTRVGWRAVIETIFLRALYLLFFIEIAIRKLFMTSLQADTGGRRASSEGETKHAEPDDPKAQVDWGDPGQNRKRG
jgi:hypothetical protein